jgi:NitT/TauT family transport system permease protein
MKKRRWSRIILPVVLSIILLILWEYLISNGENVDRINEWIEQVTGWNPDLDAITETILPRPSRILRTLVVTPSSGRGGLDYFWRHTRTTMVAAALGFILGNLLAILTATAFLYIKALERALMPLALALRSMPLVAITPLLLRIRFSVADLEAVQASPVLNAIFGTDLVMKMIIVVIIVYFPTLVNVARGLSSVEQEALELMHTLRASRWQVYWKLRVPTALPLTFAAFKVASSASVLGAVVAEWLSSTRGLGYIIYRARAEMKIPSAMMGMVIACIMSIVVFALVGLVQRWAIPWHRSVVHLRGALEAEA